MLSYKKKITITKYLLEKMLKMNKEGVALYFVLAVLFIAVLLANLVLNLISSQSKLTGHQVKRVQAYYAAQAGVNYAVEQLRLDPAWVPAGGGTRRICGSAYGAANPGSCSAPNIIESFFPSSINFVEIFVGPIDPANNRIVNATANFTGA